MKKMIILIVAFVIGLQGNAQQSSPTAQVSYGTVSTDGYSNITKGAFWSKRPESKMIYDGSYPPGYTVYVLEQDYFIRFAEDEHNSKDLNYIVFPKGEKIYKDNSTGYFYAAACGNRIVFIKPVENTLVQKVLDTVRVADNTITDVTYKYIVVEKEVIEPNFQTEVVIMDGGHYQRGWYPIIDPFISLPYINGGMFYDYGPCHYNGGGNFVTNNNTFVNNNYSSYNSTENNSYNYDIPNNCQTPDHNQHNNGNHNNGPYNPCNPNGNHNNGGVNNNHHDNQNASQTRNSGNRGGSSGVSNKVGADSKSTSVIIRNNYSNRSASSGQTNGSSVNTQRSSSSSSSNVNRSRSGYTASNSGNTNARSSSSRSGNSANYSSQSRTSSSGSVNRSAQSRVSSPSAQYSSSRSINRSSYSPSHSSNQRMSSSSYGGGSGRSSSRSYASAGGNRGFSGGSQGGGGRRR